MTQADTHNSARDEATNGAGVAPAAEAQAADASSATSEIDQLRADLESARDSMLRARAELDNYQKRVARDRAEERRYACLPLLRDLLGVRDNLDRAVKAAESGSNQANLLEGVKLVAQQLTTVFGQNACRELEVPPGAAFDPNQHEAAAKVPSDKHPEGTVIEVIRPGFAMHDRVVRPAQVVVSSGPAKGQEAGGRRQEAGEEE
jgi:molecular chaperone GrpE